MIWVDYVVEQMGNAFRVKGSYPKEAWQTENGTERKVALYKPGDCFKVDEKGWLIKIEGN